MPNKFKKNIISLCILMACATSYASNETEIYTKPTQGKKTLLMMLESSSAMDDDGNTAKRSIAQDYPTSCNGASLAAMLRLNLDKYYSKQVLLEKEENNLKTVIERSTFAQNFPYCKLLDHDLKDSEIVDGAGYSRMDRMKLAMSRLLGSNDVSSDIVMGLGQFSTHSNAQYANDYTTDKKGWQDTINNIIAEPNKYADGVSKETYPQFYPGYQSFYSRVAKLAGYGHISGNDISAKILLPAKALDNSQRYKERVAVTAMESGGAAPIASALAESGAYMLGTTTLNTDGTSPIPTDPDWAKIVEAFAITDQNYSPNGNTEGPYTYSGFAESNSDAKTGSKYKSPIDETGQCNTNGIFLVTNGIPSETPRDVAQQMMRNALNDQSFTCDDDQAPIVATKKLHWLRLNESDSGKNVNADYGWTCMAKFAKQLRAKDQNIKLAVAGFGKNFMPYLESDKSIIKDGKTYYDCKSIKAGSFPYTPYGTTTPQTYTIKPEEVQDIKNACYLGNYGSGFGEGGLYPVVSEYDLSNAAQKFLEKLTDNLTISVGLASTSVDTLNTTQKMSQVYFTMFKPDVNGTGGAGVGLWLGNIKKYMIVDNIYKDKNNQKVFDDDGIFNSTQDYWNTSGTDDTADPFTGGALSHLPIKKNRSIYLQDNSELKKLDVDQLKDKDTTDNRYLLNLLGYNVPITGDYDLSTASDLQQMGASIYSKPVFFTTQASFSDGSYSDRLDYLLFGTKQGLIQIVNADNGKEVLAFLPQDIVNDQKKSFVAKANQTSLPNYEGLDAPWTVYTSYTSESLNHVRASTLYAYGGMRRGGGSYYGLDLSDNSDGIKPKFMFQTAGRPEMGGSWSKPTIGKIKWKGKEQLVMIVGGGYDSAYDDPNYNPTTSKGNGVYIFAAESSNSVEAGELLWWASSVADGKDNKSKIVTDLKYSVVSQIKAIDRDSDGFIDNLYFGDLGGQLFRVDIDNSSSGKDSTPNIAVPNVVTLASFQESNKVAPRFYTMPTFTVTKIDGIYHAVVSIGSGDVSSPARYITDEKATTDKVYAIFDKDITKAALFNKTLEQLTTKNLNLTGLLKIGSTSFADNIKLDNALGWYDNLGNTSITQNKVLQNYEALNNTLYTTYYDTMDAGTHTTCKAGIKGKTHVKTYCLPYGSDCSYGGVYTQNATVVGVGVQSLVMGGYKDADGNNILAPVLPSSSSNLLAKQRTTLSFTSTQWYEE